VRNIYVLEVSNEAEGKNIFKIGYRVFQRPLSVAKVQPTESRGNRKKTTGGNTQGSSERECAIIKLLASEQFIMTFVILWKGRKS